MQEAALEQVLGGAAVDDESPACSSTGTACAVREGDGALDRRGADAAVELVERRLHPGLVDGDLGVVVTAPVITSHMRRRPKPEPPPASSIEAA